MCIENIQLLNLSIFSENGFCLNIYWLLYIYGCCIYILRYFERRVSDFCINFFIRLDLSYCSISIFDIYLNDIRFNIYGVSYSQLFRSS